MLWPAVGGRDWIQGGGRVCPGVCQVGVPTVMRDIARQCCCGSVTLLWCLACAVAMCYAWLSRRLINVDNPRHWLATHAWPHHDDSLSSIDISDERCYKCNKRG